MLGILDLLINEQHEPLHTTTACLALSKSAKGKKRKKKTTLAVAHDCRHQ